MSFGDVARLVEWGYGAEWWWNPARWDTLDGYAPYAEVWRAWQTMGQARALERLNVVRAISTSRAGERAQRLVDTDFQEAFPGG